MITLCAVTAAARQLSLFSGTETHSGFTVRESGRARRLSIKVYPRGRVEVVVPRRTKANEVRQFVEANADWIRKTRASFGDDRAPEPFSLPDVVNLQGIGRRFHVQYRPDRGGKGVRFRRCRSGVVLSGHIDSESQCVTALKRWMTSIAREAYLPRLKTLSSITGQAFNRLHVRGQRTCWGSRSSTGTISLNYCLMFLDPQHLRYVMIHELCHAQHMNHSARFWNLVGRHEPDYRRLDQELNGAWQQIPTWVGIC